MAASSDRPGIGRIELSIDDNGQLRLPAKVDELTADQVAEATSEALAPLVASALTLEACVVQPVNGGQLVMVTVHEMCAAGEWDIDGSAIDVDARRAAQKAVSAAVLGKDDVVLAGLKRLVAGQAVVSALLSRPEDGLMAVGQDDERSERLFRLLGCVGVGERVAVQTATGLYRVARLGNVGVACFVAPSAPSAAVDSWLEHCQSVISPDSLEEGA
jgi:hypothetical protein